MLFVDEFNNPKSAETLLLYVHAMIGNGASEPISVGFRSCMSNLSEFSEVLTTLRSEHRRVCLTFILDLLTPRLLKGGGSSAMRSKFTKVGERQGVAWKLGKKRK